MGSNEEETIWKIENFSECSLKKEEYLLSPTFIANSFDKTAWYLKFYPRGRELFDGNDGFSSCYLKRREDDAVSITIECDFIIEIINKDGRAILSRKDTKQKFGKGKGLGWHTFVNREYLLKTALDDDTLTIRCRFCKNSPPKISFSENISTTRFKISNYSFQWLFKNLETLTRQETIKFPCLGSSEIEITIKILNDVVKICIKVNENISSSQFISCNFIVLDVEGNEKDSIRATHLFENAETLELPPLIKKSDILAEKDVYLKDGCFTLHCDIVGSEHSFIGDSEENRDNPLPDKFTNSGKDTFVVLNEDIKRMYEDKIHTDIKLKVGKEVFPAHKCILCARSPVFLAMFDNDMTESQKGEIDIPDFDAKTVVLFLEYLYTGTVNDLDYENVMKLMEVADKYEVVSLVDKCAELLASVLSHVNVCEILVTADLVQHDTLKASVFNFIKLEPKKVFRSEEWKHFAKSNVWLATETSSEVAIMLDELVKEQSGK